MEGKRKGENEREEKRKKEKANGKERERELALRSQPDNALTMAHTRRPIVPSRCTP